MQTEEKHKNGTLKSPHAALQCILPSSRLHRRDCMLLAPTLRSTLLGLATCIPLGFATLGSTGGFTFHNFPPSPQQRHRARAFAGAHDLGKEATAAFRSLPRHIHGDPPEQRRVVSIYSTSMCPAAPSRETYCFTACAARVPLWVNNTFTPRKIRGSPDVASSMSLRNLPSWRNTHYVTGCTALPPLHDGDLASQTHLVAPDILPAKLGRAWPPDFVSLHGRRD